MSESSPARLYAGIVGLVLVAAGIAGFFYNSSFTDDPANRDAVLGVFDVNGWHNVFHILTGLIGLVAFMAGAYASRYYALGLGVLYAIIAVWGFILGSGDSLLNIIPVNTEDNFLHLAIALLGLGVAQAWALAAVVVFAGLFGFLVPGTATGDHDKMSQVDRGKALFVQDGCRNCHTLASSGSLGTIGPNLNDLKPDQKRVLAAIHNGGTGSGSMPKNLASGADAQAIAAYVSYATGANVPKLGGPPGKQIFAENCGSCHTLADAGTSGNVGPNLDQIKPNKALVLATIKKGPGVMPSNVVTGKEAAQVAAYVSSVAGKK